ncbi:hypothetical protein HUG12_04030 [Halorarum salinum]|uniref:Fenitrothion hydrolase n=2 Tax=Halorarum salinum TaxID=2743089 RepID=A0A7D5QDX3_9EURY|nr:hypothetical protein HUG12_04030 [Halobaculum salinum]
MEPAAVPTWLVVVTGGGVVGASFLFTSLLTDRGPMHAVAGARARPTSPRGLAGGLARAGRRAFQLVGLLALLAVLVAGLVGPLTPTANLAVLLVWAGWWAGYTMTVYLAADTWPAVNPWRTLAGLLPSPDREYPARLGAWPSVVGLLGLVWLEVTSPVTDEPRFLAALVLGYTAVTLAGAATFGREAWFGAVDPVSRVFRWYGKLAPVRRTDDGLELVVPGAALVETRPDRDDSAFVVALLWATTFDGLVSTPPWAAVAGPLVEAGVPSALLSLVALAAGFGLFYAALVAASRRSRRTADTYVTAGHLRRTLAPSLVPIAAGYHLAHYLGYFLGLAPALLVALANPLGGAGTPPTLLLPEWFGALRLSFIVLGHLAAVGVAHVVAFETFPGRLQPIRSQFPFIVIMIAYTVTSMWIVTQPYVEPV